MAKKQYSFYPGCSSERKASAANYMTSVESMCKTLDIELNEIPDWNCCGASIGYAEGGELPRHALNARNVALSEKNNPGQDIVATCAACWLGTKETSERVAHSGELLADIKEVLKEAGLEGDYKNQTPIRHMVEVLIEDFGYDELAKPVKKPLEGIKIAGYVGCQTNRPFGVDNESFENPRYLDKLVGTLGGEPIENYDQKVTCCGGALAFSEPDKAYNQINKILESAYDFGAEMIVTPCPVCQMNVEVYQEQINKKFGKKYKIPVTYYSQLMAVAYGHDAKASGLDGNIVRATKLEEIASK
ncbi:MAG: CoB--CoM heterodisulfide reductase iron-sulfur subunit B family protein [Gammaproteobacteria bacterium]|nr:CoB--CoM heterodisulfide reductase iron-sulfur subunit B family protein [Gammaproteobacteria bacterium]